MIKHLLLATLATFVLLAMPSLSYAQSTSDGEWWVNPNVAVNGTVQGGATTANTTANPTTNPTSNNLPMPVTASPTATLAVMTVGIILLGASGYLACKKR